MKIRGRKSQGDAAFGAAHDASFDSIRPAQHAARDAYPALLQQFANATGADPASTQTELRHFISKKAQTFTNRAQQIDVAFTAMAESKTAAEINFFRVQAFDNNIAQKIFGANLREVLIKVNNYGLFDAQHAQRFDFLIKSLQERRRGFGVQQCPRVRFESDHGRHGADRARARPRSA